MEAFAVMFSDPPRVVIVLIFVALSVLALMARRLRLGSRAEAYTRYLWVCFLVFTVAEVASFQIAIWILAGACFAGLREYFSLIDIRLQDRWGILGAYLAIPFMIVFIQIDWYGMFIISVPVYAFLLVPFLITLGGKETEGTVFSIGAIDFGLFLLVYCLGHIGYLTLFSTWMAIALILNVAVCDVIAYLLGSRGWPFWTGSFTKYAASIPFTVVLMAALSGWSGIPWNHSLVLGILIPVLVAVGRHTMVYIESDLRIAVDHLVPGRGRIIDSFTSALFAAPVVFHYIRYFLR